MDLKEPIAEKLFHEEGEDYRAYIQVLRPIDLMDVEPLPYRRVIGDWESEEDSGISQDLWH